MKGFLNTVVFIIAVTTLICFNFNLQARAQNSNDDLSPMTQQYIENLNEVREAQNDGKAITNPPENSDNGVSPWTYVFYGFLSGLAYAFWRWVKRLKNR